MFKVGDEIEWHDAKSVRLRGRVVKNADHGIAARPYDDLRRLGDGIISIPADASLTSGTDLLAEVVPDLYHLIADNEAETCFCGKLDHEAVALQPVDEQFFHHVALCAMRNEWSNLVRDASCNLDSTDRSRPLGNRQVPQEEIDSARDARLCAECFQFAVLAGCYPEEPPRQTDEALRKFVLAWMDRRIFSHRHCDQPKLLSMIFMCLSLAPPMPKDYAERVGLIYEFMDKAGPRAVNGQPMFFSHRLLHVDDWERVREVIQAEEEHRENLVI